jgi:hypothetical protein
MELAFLILASVELIHRHAAGSNPVRAFQRNPAHAEPLCISGAASHADRRSAVSERHCSNAHDLWANDGHDHKRASHHRRFSIAHNEFRRRDTAADFILVRGADCEATHTVAPTGVLPALSSTTTTSERSQLTLVPPCGGDHRPATPRFRLDRPTSTERPLWSTLLVAKAL